MQYYSTKTKRLYDTVKELEAAEKEFDAKQAEVEKAKKERAIAAKKVEDAYKLAEEQKAAADQLLKEFVQKYGKFHVTVDGPDGRNIRSSVQVPTIFSVLDNFPFFF